MHLIDLRSILLRCNGFARILKVTVDQTGHRPPNSNHDYFLVQVWLWEEPWSFSLSPATELAITSCHGCLIKSNFHCTSQSDEEMICCVTVKVLVAQSCLTLCDPMDCSLPGSSVHGILQARILEWVAIPFSRNLPNAGTEPGYPALQADSLPSEPLGKPCVE